MTALVRIVTHNQGIWLVSKRLKTALKRYRHAGFSFCGADSFLKNDQFGFATFFEFKSINGRLQRPGPVI